MTHWLCILVQTPAHAALGSVLSYRSELALPPGTLVRVPLGQRETLGVVWDADAAQATGSADISILGSGDVKLTGGATCKSRQVGSGTATCS